MCTPCGRVIERHKPLSEPQIGQHSCWSFLQKHKVCATIQCGMKREGLVANSVHMQCKPSQAMMKISTSEALQRETTVITLAGRRTTLHLAKGDERVIGSTRSSVKRWFVKSSSHLRSWHPSLTWLSTNPQPCQVPPTSTGPVETFLPSETEACLVWMVPDCL